jgi:hypothetical protein
VFENRLYSEGNETVSERGVSTIEPRYAQCRCPHRALYEHLRSEEHATKHTLNIKTKPPFRDKSETEMAAS